MINNANWTCSKCKNTYSYFVDTCPNCNTKQHTIGAKYASTSPVEKAVIDNTYNSIEYRSI